MASPATPTLIKRGDFILNEPFREAVHEAIVMRGWTWRSLSEASGIAEAQLRRNLGQRAHHRTKYMSYRCACAVVKALGLDPVDFDV